MTTGAQHDMANGAAVRPVGPGCPQNWYLVAGSDGVARGAIAARRLGGAEIVIYRGRDSGLAVAFAGHCAHAGCHLRHGKVVGDNLQCALHQRVIRPDGQFVARDGGILAAPLQFRLPVTERFGCIFVFAGADAAFDLPLPEICDLGPVTSRLLPAQSFPLPWSTLTSNGMDIDHLQAVHDRKLHEPPTLRRVDRHRMRLDYRAQVTGRHPSDRLMKWISGDDIRTSITCIGGSMMLVESAVGRHRTFVILSMCPAGESGSTIRAVVGVRGDPAQARTRMSARIAAWLFHAFLKKDVGILQQMDWHEPEVEITHGDALTRSLCAFFRGLPAFDLAGEQPMSRVPLRAAGRGA
jgi:aminopyrrolnitrin oxygenase